MEGKEAIIEKIIGDAEVKATEIALNANKKVASIIADANIWAKDYVSAQTEILSTDAENLISRRKTVAKIDAKKAELNEKQALLDRVYGLILDRLCKTDKASYLKYVTDSLVKYADEGDGVLLSDLSPLAESDISGIKAFKDKKLKFLGKSSFKGGIKLIGTVCDKDLSFEAFINDFRETTEKEIINELFGTVNG